jgi:hypothetical protein
MRATVYRHLDTKATIGGLAYPVEVMIVIGVPFIIARFGFPTVGMGAGALIYIAIRAASYGKPDSHIQNYILWRVRQGWSRGRLSAAARGRTPRFDYAPHVYRAPKARVKA